MTSQPVSVAHTCSASFVHFLVCFLDAAGHDGSGLARRAGITETWLREPEGRISHTHILALWRLAGAATGDEALGLAVARQAGPEALSLFGYSLMLGRTLADVFQRAARDLYLLGDLFDIELASTPRHTEVVLAVRPGLDAPPECGDAVLATILVTARRLSADATFAPLAVEMRRRVPRDITPFVALFGSAPRFAQVRNRLVFDNAALQRPVLSAHAGMAEIYDKYVASRCTATLADTVRRHVAARLTVAVPTIDMLARELHMTTRTMHRRLSAEETNYRQLVDDTRKSLSAGYLARRDLSLKQIANLLGFADASSFTRAYRRWHGIAPQQARNG